MYQDPGSVDFSQVRDHRIWERRSLTCMPLKGLSSWAALGAGQPLKTGFPEDPPQHPGAWTCSNSAEMASWHHPQQHADWSQHQPGGTFHALHP